MPDLGSRVRAAREISGPDLWREIDQRSSMYRRSAAMPTIEDGPAISTDLGRPADRLIAAVVAIVIAVTSTVVLVRTLRIEAPPSETADSAARILARIELAGSPRSMAFTDGSVWVVSVKRNVLQRIDPNTNEVVATIDVFRSNRTPNEMAATPEGLWLTAEEGGVARIDTTTNEVEARWPIQGDFVDHTHDAVWISSPDRGEVVKIDASTDEVVARILVRDRPTGLIATEWAVWVVNDDPTTHRETLTRIDPDTDRVVQVVHPRGELSEEIVWSDDGTVWVAGCIGGGYPCTWSAIGLDSATGKILHRRAITIPDVTMEWQAPFDIHTGDGRRLWGAAADYYTGITTSTGTVFEIDPGSGAVSWAFDAGTFVTDLTYGSGSVWVGEGATNRVLRIDLGP